MSLQEIANHIKEKFNFGISKHIIHRLLIPRRKGTTVSKRFKSAVSAHVPPKRNSSERTTNAYFHYTCAQVNLVNELSQIHSSETALLSVDNKNKVEIGNPVSNRRSSIRKIYLTKDALNYNDHDYPYRNTKLTLAGYQERLFKPVRSRSLSPTKKIKMPHRRSFSVPGRISVLGNSQDRLGINRVQWPRSGNLHVELYASRTVQSTSLMHTRFLKQWLQKIRKVRRVNNIIAIADGGPDWSVKGIMNLLTFGNFWKTSKLDIFVLQCYAPGHSRFNPIERTWSQLTKLLVGVVLPVQIPELNYIVPKDGDNEKWNIILDNAVRECSKFWQGRLYDGFPINVYPFLSNNITLDDLDIKHELLRNFTKVTAKKLRDEALFKELQDEYKFLVHHCNRKPFQMEFIRCENTACTHCQNLPIRENQLLKCIRHYFGGSLPTPTDSAIFPDHYRTLEEMLYFNSSILSKGSKKLNGLEFGICPYESCNYVFYSKADRECHTLLMGHPKHEAKLSNKRKTRKK